MLSRLLPKPSHFRFLPLLSSKSHPYPYPHSPPPPPLSLLRFLSTNNNNGGGKHPSSSDPWKFSQESDGKFDALFSDGPGNLAGDSGFDESSAVAGGEDGGAGKKSGEDDWLAGEEEKAWSFGGEEEEKVDGLFDVKEEGSRVVSKAEDEKPPVDMKALEEEEKQLNAVLKGKLFISIL